MQYRREVDGLRALAVLPVILFHAGLAGFSGGFVGVDVFFVISGYLITTILVSDLVQGRFSIARFYERRARRILPAFFFVVLACLPFMWLWLLASDMKDFSRSLVAVSVFASNILFWKEINYFDNATDLKPLLHTWSLAVEEQFYVFFPLLLAALWRVRRRWLVLLVALIAVVSLAFAQWLTVREPNANFFLLPSRAWELLIGALVALRLANAGDADARRPWAAPLALVGFALICGAVFMFDEGTPVPGVQALIPTVGTALVILYGRAEVGIGRVLAHPALVGIGLISYSAYLWHQPLFALARHRSPETPPTSIFLGLSLLSLALAYLSWRFVERPFRTPGRFSRAQIFGLSAAGTAVMIGIGAAGMATNGFLGRYAPEDRYLASLSKREAGAYVHARFESLRDRPFRADDPRPKLILVGDSYAEDLTNALFEAGLAERVQLSTHAISARCGNLHLDFDFSDRIDEVDRHRCATDRDYADRGLQKRLVEADIIWLASSWREWQAELLPQSLQRIERDFGKRPLVFGRKNFGDVNRLRLLQMPAADRVNAENPMSAEHLATNRLMLKTLPTDQFIDVSALLCGSGEDCRLFDDGGALVSYDGGHLSKTGAVLYGRRLAELPLIQASLQGRRRATQPEGDANGRRPKP